MEQHVEEAAAHLVRASQPDVEAVLSPETFRLIVQAVGQFIPIIVKLIGDLSKKSS